MLDLDVGTGHGPSFGSTQNPVFISRTMIINVFLAGFNIRWEGNPDRLKILDCAGVLISTKSPLRC